MTLDTDTELEHAETVERYIKTLVWVDTDPDTRGLVEANLRAFWATFPRRAAVIPDAGAEDVERVALAMQGASPHKYNLSYWRPVARAALAVMPRRDERAGMLRELATKVTLTCNEKANEEDIQETEKLMRGALLEALRTSTPEQPRDDGWQLCAHDSDCALHNGPAYPRGPCDCKLSKPMLIAGGTVEYTASDHGPFPFDGVAIASLEAGYDHWCSGQHDGGDVIHKPKYCHPLPPAPVTK